MIKSLCKRIHLWLSSHRLLFINKTTDTQEKTRKIILITGGQRSGKSVFAEKMASELSSHPTYLATARVMDEEMRRRVEIHKKRRSPGWRNLEAPLRVEGIDFTRGEVVLVDCLTMWATNWLFEADEDADKALSELRHQLDKLFATDATFIIVTNEIGLGGVSPNSLQRKFVDLQGYVNQYVASMADEVYFTISGIPVKIKSSSC